MEDEVEGLRSGAVLRLEAGLDLTEQLGAQLHIARLVDAVHVAEGEGRHIAAVFAEAESLHGGDRIVDRRVKVLVDVVAHAILFAADDADLHLEDRVDCTHAGQQFLRKSEILVERHGRTVPHVRLENRVAPGFHLGLGCFDQRQHETGEGILRAVVGVQRDGDRVVFRRFVDEGCERERAGGTILHRVAGEVVGATGGHLDDAVRTRLGESLQHGIDRLR